MITLAVDTTAVTVTAAVREDDRTLSLFTLNTSKNHGEMLLPMIDSQLKPLGLSLDDIGLYAVSVGPGSFTGVRVGVSLIKGLAYDGKPCAAVSSLEALAEIPNDGTVITAFVPDETLSLKNGVLSVNTADTAEEDNTLPITSAAVFTEIGNINVLLGTI